MKKSDIVAVVVLGEILAVFLNFVLKGLEIVFPYPIWILFAALPILALIAVYIAYLIGRKFLIVFQFAKYATVGLANTAVDFGILNLLMWSTRIYSGKNLFWLNSISFLVAVIHSYVWNKLWTFKAKEKTAAAKQFLQFLVVSIIGVLINSGIVYIITTWVNPMTGKETWANLAKVAATIISLLWNFIGYKFIVFKKKNDGISNLSQI